MTLGTPRHTHLKKFRNVYPPAEDTFLLLDALEEDADLIRQLTPTVCVEIGCGSGIVISFLSMLNGPGAAYIATDVNVEATTASLETAATNKVGVDFVLMEFTTALLARLRRSVDVVIFNPPYVVTPSEEVGSRSIAAAWAGGVDGREVIDAALPFVDEVLSESGVFYLVVIAENRPEHLQQVAHERFGWISKVVLSRRAGNEGLSVLRFEREGKGEPPETA
ncbi:N6-adenine-specific DNA methyltransferase 1 [Cladochytrium replicatum]|nr:N6-adenine-specific DNA methyltransferase 1 [Cladochytrium replicatum]